MKKDEFLDANLLDYVQGKISILDFYELLSERQKAGSNAHISLEEIANFFSKNIEMPQAPSPEQIYCEFYHELKKDSANEDLFEQLVFSIDPNVLEFTKEQVINLLGTHNSILHMLASFGPYSSNWHKTHVLRSILSSSLGKAYFTKSALIRASINEKSEDPEELGYRLNLSDEFRQGFMTGHLCAQHTSLKKMGPLVTKWNEGLENKKKNGQKNGYQKTREKEERLFLLWEGVKTYRKEFPEAKPETIQDLAWGNANKEWAEKQDKKSNFPNSNKSRMNYFTELSERYGKEFHKLLGK